MSKLVQYPHFSFIVSWLQLIHYYFEELPQQPIATLECNQEDCLEGFPFLSCVSDSEVNFLSSHHLQRRFVFLFLRFSLSLINRKGGTNRNVLVQVGSYTWTMTQMQSCSVVKERKDFWSFIIGFKDIFRLICSWTMKCTLQNVQTLPNHPTIYQRGVPLSSEFTLLIRFYYVCIQLFSLLNFMFVFLRASFFNRLAILFAIFLSHTFSFLDLIFNCRIIYYSKCYCNFFLPLFLQKNCRESIS